MPPKSNATAARDTAALGSLIASEVRMIDSIFRNSCSKSKPTMTNWAKVTAELGFKNEKSTKDTFRHICKKHKWYESEDNESAAPKAPTTPESKDKKDRDGPTTPNSKRLRSPARYVHHYVFYVHIYVPTLSHVYARYSLQVVTIIFT